MILSFSRVRMSARFDNFLKVVKSVRSACACRKTNYIYYHSGPMNKKRILKILRYLGFSLLGLIGLIALYFLSAYILSSIGTNPPKVSCEVKTMAFLSSNEVHVDLILPISELDSNFVKTLQPIDGARFVAFGWGDRGFYLETPSWEDLKYSTVFKALFLYSPAVMHVSFYSNASLLGRT